MRSHKRDPTPQIIVAAPYPFSCLPISFPIRRLTVILARLPHPVTLTVHYPSACFRLLGACFRLLDRGKAVRRESRGAAEATDGGGRVVLLAVLLPAHELHDVTGKCLPHRLVGGGLLRLLGRGEAVRRESRQPAEVTDGTRSRLSQPGLSAQGAAFQTGDDNSPPLLFLLPAAGDGLLHPGSLLCFLFLIANVVHEDQFLAVFAQDILIQELFSLTREHFSIISCLPDNMESINSFMVQPEFERTLRADQIFDPGQRNDGLHLLPFPIKESDAEFIDLLCKLPQRVACHPKERTVGIEAQDLVDRVILCRGHICKLLCAIRMGDHAHGLVHLLHTVRHLADLHAWSVVLVVVLVVLVILVVFVFLQKWRTTLIPVLAVPVSIVGTFASFKVLDFTINTLTLFAMVLAIGLVVDDAIVVIENVEEHMSKDKLSAKDATEAAMKEVQGPIIATTAVLASIFIPVAFIGGVTGVLYKQFAVTITISVVISAFVALTLTPALCGVLLKPGDKAIQGGPLGAFFRGFNGAFDHFRDRYTGKVGWMIHHLKYAAVFLILVTGLMGIFYQVLPSTFVPDEDQGVFMASITMPEGTSLNQTIKTVDAAAEETRQIPGVKDVMTHAGGSTSNTGNLYVALENWDGRQSNDLSAESIIAKFNKTVVPNHPEARVAAFNPSSLPGMGQEGGWTMQLMDNTGLSDTELGNAANQVVAACSQRPELSGVRTSYATNTPSVAYTVDREKIKNLGIELSDVFTALQTNFGGSSVNDFTQFGRSYKVIVQADTSYRSQADSLKFISVKSSSGKMVPLDTLLTSSMTTGPSSITRFNGVRSVTIQGSAASGYSSGEAMAAAEEAAKSVMPTGMTIEWSGQSREESTSSSSTTKILIMALVFAFLCLAALYESWSMPFAVLFTVPTGIFGAVGSEYIIRQLATLFNANTSSFLNSVYMQIGVIMIIGLAAKNAILIVEFAKERVDKGIDPMEAVVIASKLRLRPILMTAFTAIIGCLPLAFASGAGAGARCGMGVAVVGGMTFATLCGLLLIPAFYIISEKMARNFWKATGLKRIKFKYRMLRR